MEIVFNQAEITEALSQYAHQRINLTGKTIDIKLTAGRGEGNFRAEISVEDARTDSAAQPAAVATPATSVARTTRSTARAEAQPAKEEAPIETAEAQATESPFTDAEQAEAAEPTAPVEKKSVSSLFGGKKSAE